MIKHVNLRTYGLRHFSTIFSSMSSNTVELNCNDDRIYLVCTFGLTVASDYLIKKVVALIWRFYPGGEKFWEDGPLLQKQQQSQDPQSILGTISNFYTVRKHIGSFWSCAFYYIIFICINLQELTTSQVLTMEFCKGTKVTLDADYWRSLPS